MKKCKRNNGITLVALVITIIILLILSAITIIQLQKNDLIEKVNEAKSIQENAQNKENSILEEYSKNIDKYSNSISNDGLIGKLSKIEESGYFNIQITGKINGIEEIINYNVHAIVYNGDLILDGKNQIDGAILNENVYEFGDETNDVGTQNDYAKNMVLFKVNGNLIINEEITLTSCKSKEGYGGPKGMTIYCTGTLTNNGTISMTERGAKAEGENVYLWKNSDESYEFVPKDGVAGGIGGTSPGSYKGSTGTTPNVASARATGGGGGAAGQYSNYKGGNGSAGTSYSGGTGGGGSRR